ncbi:26S proteasome complex subunit [Exophiala dermatitidis]|nr:26S proteasome complex subunit [Exophiala dermatitidis]KAJ4541143.1 26S proteasome complex subunit [Exophiala dermatitidis]KAJ4608980.1 26S proteasome complex subunit, variant 2 [Exophiala dermatitidis]KAJ4691316.1 26S proteasome complex subunit [Exophiala dermatitidis]KAJ8997315.1 26S proteasome complex subunit [Exophiala dermatitidis]
MSSGSSNTPTAKMQPTQKNEVDPAQASKTATNPQPALLEEDDEFEDFPVEGMEAIYSSVSAHGRLNVLTPSTDWAQEDTDVPGGTTHLWEESWDDDDQNEDFSKQLKEELKKVEATK